jgi:5-methylcytosine-specific restriction endonuclease McrA
VHHIVGINQGGEPYDLDNLESLCTPCHSRVTALELAGKETTIKGVDPLTGKPADPRHPFNAKKISQG